MVPCIGINEQVVVYLRAGYNDRAAEERYRQQGRWNRRGLLGPSKPPCKECSDQKDVQYRQRYPYRCIEGAHQAVDGDHEKAEYDG